MKINYMTALETYTEKKALIKKKLSTVKFPKDAETWYCWKVAGKLNVSGVTVKNYINGNIKDGYLAEAIYSVFQSLKLVK